MAKSGSIKRLTQKSAIDLHNTGFYMKMNDRDLAKLQLYQPILFMPFDKFHVAMETSLDRPIQSMEFGLSDLIPEFEAATGETVEDENAWVNLLPKDVRNLVEFE